MSSKKGITTRLWCAAVHMDSQASIFLALGLTIQDHTYQRHLKEGCSNLRMMKEIRKMFSNKLLVGEEWSSLFESIRI